MRVQPKAFLAIEQTMAAAMKSQWDGLARDLVAKLQPLLAAGKWAEAQDVVNKIDLSGVVSKVAPKIEELCVSALLFGAHHATGSILDTDFHKGKKLPPEVKAAVRQLVVMVEHDGRNLLRNYLHEVIEDAKKADPRAHMQKASIVDQPEVETDEMRENRRFAVNGGHDDWPDQTGEQMRAREEASGGAGELRKDDISTEELAETGGLMEPEQVEDTAPKRRKRGRQRLTKTDGKKTLYVHRPLKNAWEVIAWADAQGFKAVQRPEDMHVTICYSKTSFDWDDLEPKQDNVANHMISTRKVRQFGDAVVLTFDSALLVDDHQELRDAGASYDFDHYQPHVTISWEKPPKPVDEIEPFQGVLDLGPEVFAPINDDWKDDHEEIVLRKAERTLADMLNDAVLKGKKVPIDTAASLTTSRLISLGFLGQAMDDGHEEYQVNEVLDDRTCKVCQFMNGKVFNVAHQHARVMQALGTDDPHDLKDIAPWPQDVTELMAMSPEEMQHAGYGSPPYHPGCRGFLTAAPGHPAHAIVGLKPPAADDVLEEGEDLAAEAEADASAVEALPTEASAEFEAAATDREMGALTHDWTPAEIEELKWDHLQITDPDTFKAANDAFEAGEFDKAKEITEAFQAAHAQGVEKVDADPTTLDPYAGKKKRQDQQAAGENQDYDDVSPRDSSPLGADPGLDHVFGMNDNGAPLDRV